jgi:hypothetical protein
MAKLRREVLVVLAMTAAFAGWAMAAEPQAAPGAFEKATLVSQLLEAAFPDWKDKLITIRIAAGEGVPRGASFSAWDSLDEPEATESARDAIARLWINGQMEVDQAGVRSVNLAGKAVHSIDNYLLHDDASNLKTPEQVAAALVARGARFPPAAREAFQSWVKQFDFSPILGKTRIVSIEFVGRSDPDPRYDLLAEWVVLLRGSRGVSYQLFFEPFGGRLRGLIRS